MDEKLSNRRDEIAQVMFHDSYNRLSAFGQAQVNNALITTDTPRVSNEDSLRLHSAELTIQNHRLRVENLDLMDELEELKGELEELRAQWNNPDS